MFELVENVAQSAEIKVVGVGGGGGNAVHHMINNQVEGVEFICANTDAQALNNLKAKTILQMGSNITRVLVRVLTPRSADRQRWKTETRSPRSCLAPTWCLLPLAWVEAQEQAPLLSSLKSLGKWVF